MGWIKLLAKVSKLRFDGSLLQGSKWKLRVTEVESCKIYSLDFLESSARLGCYEWTPKPKSLTPPPN